MVVLEAGSSSFEPLVRYELGEDTWAQPSISGNRIFVKDVTSLALWTVE